MSDSAAILVSVVLGAIAVGDFLYVFLGLKGRPWLFRPELLAHRTSRLSLLIGAMLFGQAALMFALVAAKLVSPFHAAVSMAPIAALTAACSLGDGYLRSRDEL